MGNPHPPGRVVLTSASMSSKRWDRLRAGSSPSLDWERGPPAKQDGDELVWGQQSLRWDGPRKKGVPT
jgi:hypothetical protein